MASTTGDAYLDSLRDGSLGRERAARRLLASGVGEARLHSAEEQPLPH